MVLLLLLADFGLDSAQHSVARVTMTGEAASGLAVVAGDSALGSELTDAAGASSTVGWARASSAGAAAAVLVLAAVVVVGAGVVVVVVVGAGVVVVVVMAASELSLAPLGGATLEEGSNKLTGAASLDIGTTILGTGVVVVVTGTAASWNPLAVEIATNNRRPTVIWAQ